MTRIRFLLTMVAVLAVTGSLGALIVAVATGVQQATRVEELEEVQESQSARVERVLRENRRIEAEHQAIGTQLAETEKELENALARSRQRQIRLPAELARLRPFVRRGFLAPRTVPRALARRDVRIARYRDGYVVAWPGAVSFFASTRRGQALHVLLAARSPRDRREIELGRRAVVRTLGTLSVYAWNERERAYTVLAQRGFRGPALTLIRSTR